MPKPKDVYVNCDILENLPKLNRDNWLCEIELLSKELPQNARILQVGSMDGTRIIKLLEIRPDLNITGIEIEESLVEVAKQNVTNAEFIHGDITNPPSLSKFDYVICLNNTLGYIPEIEKAIEKMKELGNKLIISVYGEKFTNDLAKEYFKIINLEIDHIENDWFVMKDFSKVKRFSREEINSWNAKVIETPIGYFCII
jgi:SAM-dependent methyltransferase